MICQIDILVFVIALQFVIVDLSPFDFLKIESPSQENSLKFCLTEVKWIVLGFEELEEIQIFVNLLQTQYVILIFPYELFLCIDIHIQQF